MKRVQRSVAAGLAHHFRHGGFRLFAGAGQCREYLELVGEACRRHGVRVLAWCLMPNHVHLIVVPPRMDSLRRALGGAHLAYTRRRNRELGLPGRRLWAGRPEVCVLDERHALAAARAAEMNPVRKRLVARPEDWPWSSARYHLGLLAADALVAAAELPERVAGWREWLALADPAAEERVKQCTRTGRPAGSRRFVDRVAMIVSHKLRKRRPGRKPDPALARRRPNYWYRVLHERPW